MGAKIQVHRFGCILCTHFFDWVQQIAPIVLIGCKKLHPWFVFQLGANSCTNLGAVFLGLGAEIGCRKHQNKTRKKEILENIISNRIEHADASTSYVASLFNKGINKVAQKVGEEAVELVIEAKDNNDTLFLNESADLLFHYLLLLQAKGFKLNDVVENLKARER